MIILTPDDKLEVKLGGAVSTVEPQVVVFSKLYRAEDAREGFSREIAVTAGTADVTIAAKPRSGTTKVVEAIHIHNRDDASVTMTIQIDDGTANRTIWKATLATLESVTYETGTGWQCYTTAGAIK